MTLSEQYRSFPVSIRDLVESKFSRDVSKYLTPSIIELMYQWLKECYRTVKGVLLWQEFQEVCKRTLNTKKF